MHCHAQLRTVCLVFPDGPHQQAIEVLKIHLPRSELAPSEGYCAKSGFIAYLFIWICLSMTVFAAKRTPSIPMIQIGSKNRRGLRRLVRCAAFILSGVTLLSYRPNRSTCEIGRDNKTRENRSKILRNNTEKISSRLDPI
jgi:hypothetical protein